MSINVVLDNNKLYLLKNGEPRKPLSGKITPVILESITANQYQPLFNKKNHSKFNFFSKLIDFFFLFHKETQDLKKILALNNNSISIPDEYISPAGKQLSIYTANSQAIQEQEQRIIDWNLAQCGQYKSKCSCGNNSKKTM